MPHIDSIPDFHDGTLYGVLVYERDTLNLYIQTDVGEHYIVKLPGLEHLKVDNFLRGNIIGDIQGYIGKECPVEIIRKSFHYEPTEKAVFAYQHKIASNNWGVLELETSYGCNLIAVFSRPFDEIQLEKSDGVTHL